MQQNKQLWYKRKYPYLITSYPNKRTQQVGETNLCGRLVLSDEIAIIKSVPQETILEPLLYIMYTNELCHETEQYTGLYDDDTTLIFAEYEPDIILVSVTKSCEALYRYFSMCHDLIR